MRPDTVASMFVANIIITPTTILPCASTNYVYPVAFSQSYSRTSRTVTPSDSHTSKKETTGTCCKVRNFGLLELPLSMTFTDIYTSTDAMIAQSKYKNQLIDADMTLVAALPPSNDLPTPYKYSSTCSSGACGLSPDTSNPDVSFDGAFQKEVEKIYETIGNSNIDNGSKRALGIRSSAYMQNPGNTYEAQVSRDATLSFASVLSGKPDPMKPVFKYPNLITPLDVSSLLYDSAAIYRDPRLYQYSEDPVVTGTYSRVQSIPGISHTVYVNPNEANFIYPSVKWPSTLGSTGWVDPSLRIDMQTVNASFAGVTDGLTTNYYPGVQLPGAPPFTAQPNIARNAPYISDPPNSTVGRTATENNIIKATNLVSDNNVLYPALSVNSVYNIDNRNMDVTYILYKDENLAYEQFVTISIDKLGPIIENLIRSIPLLTNDQRVNLLLSVGLKSGYGIPTDEDVVNAFIIWVYTYIGYVGGTHWKVCGQPWIPVGNSGVSFNPYDDTYAYGYYSFNVDYMLDRSYVESSKPVLELEYPLVLPMWRRLCSMARGVGWDTLMFAGCAGGDRDIIARKQNRITRLTAENLWQIKNSLQILFQNVNGLDDRVSTLEVLISKMNAGSLNSTQVIGGV